MNKDIQNFEIDLIERMSRYYHDELLYFTTLVPDPLINFNDVLLLKKGQKYVSHTNTLFQKSIASLFSSLYKSNGINCSICKTDGGKGRGIYIKTKKIRLHFLGQEKFVNFPRVSWFQFKEGNDSFDLYLVIIKKNKVGIDFVKEANKLMAERNISTKRFSLLEDFVVKEFGVPIWNELNETMNDIESKTRNYQWFGLINYYNDLTKMQYLEQIAKTLIDFDYQSLLGQYTINKRDMTILRNKFIDKKGYRLLLGDNDFASSFITSEWLFKNMNVNDSLEKTYMVTGYTKSVEQLMAYIIRQSSNENDKIGIVGAGGIKKVDVQSDDFYKATLGNMLYYLDLYSNRHIYIDGISNLAIKKSIEIIREWIRVERNGYFHKHNIQSTERVIEIREKTYLLYFLLISLINIQVN